MVVTAASRAGPEHRVGLITRVKRLALGLTEDAIDGLVATGHLILASRGVY